MGKGGQIITRVPLVKGFLGSTESTDSNQVPATSLGNASKLGVGGLGREVGKQGVRNKVLLHFFVCSNSSNRNSMRAC